ncbi:MAG TPA: dihydroxyacetone kinase subunit DhaL [Pseudonocardiaceae bacterium]|jgi:dihydroxyacetone kinase-like protein|nr:dihydroxyacetone kinase subunit DhaL [Pseudonocardiaceae bacterium]
MSRELTGPQARAWMQRFIDVVHRQRDVLAELDRRAGDGDFGTNVTSALRQASRRMSEGPSDSASAVFARVSEGFLDTGGTSGPLLGMWFRELSKATAHSADAGALAAGVAAGVAAVQRLGQAQVGDKTMVDAMLPAAEAMTGQDLDADLAAAARAARTGAASTQKLRARRGRASYVGDVAVGVLDPGAVTVALFFESARA